MIWPVAKFICQVFYGGLKLPANIRVVSKRSGYRGDVYIKLFRNVLYSYPAQSNILGTKYKVFTNSNRLRNRLQMFYLNSIKIILLNLTSDAFVKEILLFSFLECVEGTQLI